MKRLGKDLQNGSDTASSYLKVERNVLYIKNTQPGNSLVVQSLGLSALSAGARVRA